MIYKEFDAYELEEEFSRMNRDYYTIEGYQAIVDYFEDCDFELDVIAICCDFTEANYKDILNGYSNVLESEGLDLEAEDWTPSDVTEWLNYHTWATELSCGGIIYVNW